MAAPVLGVKMLCFLEQTHERQTSADSEVLGLSLGLMQAKLLLLLAVPTSNEILIEPLLPATHTI